MKVSKIKSDNDSKNNYSAKKDTNLEEGNKLTSEISNNIQKYTQQIETLNPLISENKEALNGGVKMKICFIIFGIGSLLAWNAILSDISFFMNYQGKYQKIIYLYIEEIMI